MTIEKYVFETLMFGTLLLTIVFGFLIVGD